jgi:hypothetical protein
MDEMKLVLIIQDCAWFWVYNAQDGVWEGWVEYGDEPGQRMSSNDTRDIESTLALMRLRVRSMETVAQRQAIYDNLHA